MLEAAKQIYHNPELYGHSLTQLPGKLYNCTSQFDILSYAEPIEGTTKSYFGLFDTCMTVVEYHSNGNVKKTESRFNITPLIFLEITTRKIGEVFLTVIACLIIAPVGFAIKLAHHAFR